MVKKLIVAILALSMVFTLGACGKKNNTDDLVDNGENSNLNSGVDRPDGGNDSGSFGSDNGDYPYWNPSSSAGTGEVVIYDTVKDENGEEVRSSDTAGYGFNEDGLLVEIDPATILVDIESNPELNGEYEYRTPSSSFQGVLVDDPTNTNSEYVQPITDLLSGTLYFKSVDIEVDESNWEDLVYAIIDNPDAYNGKTIRIQGQSVKYGNYAKIYVGDSDIGLTYKADAYPNNSSNMLLIGTIKKGIVGMETHVDTIQLSYILN